MMRYRSIVLALAMVLIGGPAAAQADFEGIWEPRHPPGAHPPLAEVKLTPAGRAAYERFGPDKDPTLRCIMPGIPLGLIDPYPLEIVQQKHQILLLHEQFHEVRRIFMDGRTVPDRHAPSLMGYSTGRWEGKTLVIRTTHLSPDNNMTMTGLPFSGDARTYVVERWSRDGNVLTFRGEVHDPTYYEEPYVVNGRWDFAPKGEIWEYECIPEFGGVL
jgi:hypothetical protein